MSLVFAGIVPHPPLLLPSVGKEETEKLQKTHQALLAFEEALYLSKPHIIAIISPHGDVFDTAFSINAHTHFTSSFDTFGDHDTKDTWKGAPHFAAKIGHMGNEERLEIQLISEEKLDYGASIPLHIITSHLPNIHILPISPSRLDAKQHIAFGRLLKEHIMSTDKRVALISSIDLSQALSNDAPAGFSKTAKEYDEKIISSLESRNTAGILGIEESLVDAAHTCSYKSLLILLGALQNVNFSFKNLCYESPFGVGYLTGDFILQ